MAKTHSAFFTSVKVDIKKLNVLQTGIAAMAEESLRGYLKDVLEHIRSHWSPEAPSAPFAEPAVVTGYLDQSFTISERQAGGRFGSLRGGDVVAMQLYSSAEYSGALEYGREMAFPRPFMKPAFAAVDSSTFNFLLREEIVKALRGNPGVVRSYDPDILKNFREEGGFR